MINNSKEILYKIFIGSIYGEDTTENFIGKLDEYIKENNRVAYTEEYKQKLISAIKTLSIYKDKCLSEGKFKQTFQRLYDNKDGDRIDGLKDYSGNVKYFELDDYRTFIKYEESINIIEKLLDNIGWQSKKLIRKGFPFQLVLEIDYKRNDNPMADKSIGGIGCCTYEAEGEVSIIKMNRNIYLYVSKDGERVSCKAGSVIGKPIYCGTIKDFNNIIQDFNIIGLYICDIEFEDSTLEVFIEVLRTLNINNTDYNSLSGTLDFENIEFNCHYEKNNIVLKDVVNFEAEYSLIHMPNPGSIMGYEDDRYERYKKYKRYKVNNFSIIYIKGLRKNYNFIIKDSKKQNDNKNYGERIISQRIGYYIDYVSKKDISPMINKSKSGLNLSDKKIKQEIFYEFYAKKEKDMNA